MEDLRRHVKPSVEHLVLLGVIVLAICYRIGLGPWTTDDAYITFRYANHIAQGMGFIYNTGERILGTTTPLYTLLLAGAKSAGADLINTSLAINIVADVLTLVLVYQIGKQLQRPVLGLLCGLFIAISSQYAYYTVSGMETPLYVTTMVALFWATLKQSWRLAAILSALLILIRIDGVLFVGVMLASAVLARRQIGWQPMLIFAGVLTPWVLFATFYFGSPIPQSVFAKYRHGAANDRRMSVITFAAYFTNTADADSGADKNLVFAGLALVGTAVLTKKSGYRALIPYLAWAWLYTAIFIYFNVFTYYWWYFIPLYPIYFFCLIVGGLTLLESEPIARAWYQVTARWFPRTRQWLQPAVLLLLLGVAWLLLPLRISSHRNALARFTDKRQGAYRLIAEYITQHSAPTTTIGDIEIGTLGYYSERRILDAAGLVMPNPVSESHLEALEELQPDWWVSYREWMDDTLGDPWFEATYVEVTAPIHHSPAVVVYQKVTTLAQILP